MNTIFELAFNKNSRLIRLLYSIFYADTRFLPNTVHVFLKEKKIDIYDEEKHKLKISFVTSSDNSTTSIDSQSSNGPNTSQASSLSLHANEIVDRDSASTSSSQKNADLSSNIAMNIDEYVLFY